MNTVYLNILNLQDLLIANTLDRVYKYYTLLRYYRFYLHVFIILAFAQLAVLEVRFRILGPPKDRIFCALIIVSVSRCVMLTHIIMSLAWGVMLRQYQ
jgi:hypothetical protein